MTEHTTHSMVIRRKPVIVRELPPGTPEVIGAPIEIRSAAPPPAIAEAVRSPDPVVDPTHLGRRRRRPSHVRQYRIAQILTALSMLCSAAGVVCLLLGDRLASFLIMGGGLLLASLGLLLSWRNPLTGRVLGYAWAAMALAIAASAAGLVTPHHWFDEPEHDILQPDLQKVRPRSAS